MKILFKISFSVILFLSLSEFISFYFVRPRLEEKLREFDHQKYDETFRALGHHASSTSVELSNAKVPHPFFGFIPEEYSFETLENFMAQKKSDIIRIGIFGGSVAESFGSFLIRTQYLNHKLRDSIYFKNKKIEIVNFAAGGYRQPTSLMTSLIYGHTLDIAINVEGNNEIKNGHEGFVPVYYPEPQISTLYFSGLEKLSELSDGIETAKKVRKLSSYLEIKWLPSTLRSFVLGLIIRLRVRSTQWEKKVSVPTKFFYREEKNFPTLRDIGNFWIKSSCQQQNALSDMGVLSMFVIQPLPFIPDNKVMTENEKKWVEAHNSESLRIEMSDEIKTVASIMKKIKLNSYDFSSVFKGLTEEFYVDGCCHLNVRGNEVVADNLSVAIKSLVGRKNTQDCDLKKLSQLSRQK